MSLSPYRVELALRALMADVDYDIHKQLECDEETGESQYPELVQNFIDSYGERTEKPEPMWEAMDCPDVTDDPFYS